MSRRGPQIGWSTRRVTLATCVGRAMVERRIQLNLTQKEAAARVNVPQTSWCLWENGKRGLPLNALALVAKALRVEPSMLLVTAEAYLKEPK